MNIFNKTILLFILLCLSNLQIASKSNQFYEPFKPNIHKEINKRNLKKVLRDLDLHNSKTDRCKTSLIRSQFFQDIFLLSQSKAHFDNCAFQKSINYINRIIAQNNKFSEQFNEGLNSGLAPAQLNVLRRKILFNSGKILHAIQDFYSHSNYLKLMKDRKNLEDIPTIKFWDNLGQKKILDLEKKGLVSGVAWWVFPQKCPKNSTSHANLGKDSVKYKLGKKKTAWINAKTKKNLNGFEVSLHLAEKSTYEFLLHSFNKYPMLKSYCSDSKP